MRVRRAGRDGPIVVEDSAGVGLAPVGSELAAPPGTPLAVLLDPTTWLHSTTMSAPLTSAGTATAAATGGTRHVVLAHHTAQHEWLLLWFGASELVAEVGAAPEAYGIEVVDITSGVGTAR